jgi:hypothetical protein
MSNNGFRWESDRNGDALWSGDTFLGCIYDRSYSYSGSQYRVLVGEEMRFLTDVEELVLGENVISARMHARQVLEEECGWAPKMPTAQELLEMTSREGEDHEVQRR